MVSAAPILRGAVLRSALNKKPIGVRIDPPPTADLYRINSPAVDPLQGSTLGEAGQLAVLSHTDRGRLPVRAPLV